jgi:hypothetical protein
MSLGAAGALVASFAAAWVGLFASPVPQDEKHWYRVTAERDAFGVGGGWTSHRPGAGTSFRTTAPPDPYEYRRIPHVLCRTHLMEGEECGPDAVLPARDLCEDGSRARDPLFRTRSDVPVGTPPEWELVDPGGCPEDPTPPVTVTAEDFRRLPLRASGVAYQPADGRGLVGVELVVHTAGEPQTLMTTVLGVPVAVRATPSRFSWDFGDGSPPVVTTDPGAPWPHHAAARAYDRPGTYQVRLTTTWTGQYRINDTGPWQDITGTATTLSAPFTTVVEEAPARLVADLDH